jgi:hypothetical protein
MTNGASGLKPVRAGPDASVSERYPALQGPQPLTATAIIKIEKKKKVLDSYLVSDYI